MKDQFFKYVNPRVFVFVFVCLFFLFHAVISLAYLNFHSVHAADKICRGGLKEDVLWQNTTAGQNATEPCPVGIGKK